MLPSSPAGAAADLPDAVEERLSFEFGETADVAATAPAPTLRKSRRVVFISTPPETCLTDMGFLRSTRDARECHAAAAPGRILFTILTSKGSRTSSPPVFFRRSKWGVAIC